MKFSLAALTAGLLSGCIVTSVCPFYTAKDVVFEPALIGNWVKADPNQGTEVWKFQKSGENAYRFILIESEKASLFEAHAFKLGDQLFLDIFTASKDLGVIPPHCLLKVSQLTPTLKVAHMNPDWLKTLLAHEPNAIANHLVSSGDNPDDVRVVLTAGTPDLQKFVRKHLNSEEAWAEGLEFKRE